MAETYAESLYALSSAWILTLVLSLSVCHSAKTKKESTYGRNKFGINFRSRVSGIKLYSKKLRQFVKFVNPQTLRAVLYIRVEWLRQKFPRFPRRSTMKSLNTFSFVTVCLFFLSFLMAFIALTELSKVFVASIRGFFCGELNLCFIFSVTASSDERDENKSLDREISLTNVFDSHFIKAIDHTF